MMHLVEVIGAYALAACRNMGGLLVLSLRSIVAFVFLRFRWKELVHALYEAYVVSALSLLAVFFLTGLALGAGVAFAVRPTGAVSLVGFAVGYAVLNEVGPVFAGIVFAGTVVTRNTVTLHRSPPGWVNDSNFTTARRFLAGRILGMALALPFIALPGCLLLFVGAAIGGTPLGVSSTVFQESFLQNIHTADFLRGLVKMFVFGFLASVVSHYFGLKTDVPSRAVENAVSVTVAGLILLNFLLTFALT